MRRTVLANSKSGLSVLGKVLGVSRASPMSGRLFSGPIRFATSDIASSIASGEVRLAIRFSWQFPLFLLIVVCAPFGFVFVSKNRGKFLVRHRPYPHCSWPAIVNELRYVFVRLKHIGIGVKALQVLL